MTTNKWNDDFSATLADLTFHYNELIGILYFFEVLLREMNQVNFLEIVDNFQQ